ncbi:major capsid protein [Microviridae sp.]|nr:major capsid protein [Microviridae sp.]
MKTEIGGDRLGSGNKSNISMRNYERSTHDLGYKWRSSMSAGTLVPFMNFVALPGDTFDIDLDCDVLTLPTIGPLFGSFKVQLDVFSVPYRLYNASLHMNRLGIGLDMAQVLLPQWELRTNYNGSTATYDDNEQVSSSSLAKYLGIAGLGKPSGLNGNYTRQFNAIPLLAYWDIYKNYYANKQEERGFGIHANSSAILGDQTIIGAKIYTDNVLVGDCLTNNVSAGAGEIRLEVEFGPNAQEPDLELINIRRNGSNGDIADKSEFNTWSWNDYQKKAVYTGRQTTSSVTWYMDNQQPLPLGGLGQVGPNLVEFPLANIDDMREDILQAPKSTVFEINDNSPNPYRWSTSQIQSNPIKYGIQYAQEGLGVKTYQSDLFNNWIDTEWIDGANGVNAVTSVDTTGDSFTIDALNLAKKVYVMLNRIAISGGTYDDWLDAVYTHERMRNVESPVYMGSLIKELGFQEVISTAESTSTEGQEQKLGTLAGRGRLAGKHKGGKIKVKTDEPSVIMGIVSLTPRVDYSQGNDWSVNLKTINDLHKPALDQIGYQDLITEQMAWQDSGLAQNGVVTYRSAGKVPAWINYMTNVNKTYGNFAEQNKEMFMTLNRRYDINASTGRIDDLTTYIDPTKFNHIFAQTNIDAMNFWVQIQADVIARRKMSAKVIPNL